MPEFHELRTLFWGLSGVASDSRDSPHPEAKPELQESGNQFLVYLDHTKLTKRYAYSGVYKEEGKLLLRICRYLQTLWQTTAAAASLAVYTQITTHPANTKRNKYVIITPKRRFGVIITCLLRCVFAGEASW